MAEKCVGRGGGEGDLERRKGLFAGRRLAMPEKRVWGRRRGKRAKIGIWGDFKLKNETT